jgi:hypothetical protein
MSPRPGEFHEPLAPNGAIAYGNLCTVVQAFPLAALLSTLRFGQPSIYDRVITATTTLHFSTFPWIEVNESILLILAVAAIWHRYVTDNNYIAWELNWIDTLVPFGFGILQSFIALSISSGSMVWFEVWVLGVVLLGLAAYWQLIPKLRHPHSKSLYVSHFNRRGNGEEILRVVEEHFVLSRFMLGVAIPIHVLAILIIFLFANRTVDIIIVDVTVLPILTVLLVCDLPSRLRPATTTVTLSDRIFWMMRRLYKVYSPIPIKRWRLHS